MNLFSKLKDYNSELEDILDKKVFSSTIKNLLLSMVYKIEIAYKDYKEVKRNVKSQDEFLAEIINAIKLYCDHIKTVEPDTEEAQLLENNHVLALTNEKERSILCYPTELSLLFAISDIIPKYFYISQDFIFKDALQTILVNGFNYHNLELLSNFNGWSWDVQQKNPIEYSHHLIYQNLLLMVGDQFLTQWRNYSSSKRDFLSEIMQYIKSITGTNAYFYRLCSVIYKTTNKKEQQKMKAYLTEKVKELKKMQDKEKYLENCKTRKLKLTRLVEKLDMILNDEELLIKEYAKANRKLDEDKKIGSIKIYANMLIRERENYMMEINNIAALLKPINFLKRKQELENYENILKNKNTLEEDLIALEKEFLIFLHKKMRLLKTRDEIIDMLYQLRYFKNIPFNKNLYIADIEILNNAIDKIMKKIITKACKMGIIKIISMDIALNYEIIQYALDTKIIELEGIKLSFELKEDALFIQVYDKEIFEKQGKKKVQPSKDLLEVKLKKMVKLFT